MLLEHAALSLLILRAPLPLEYMIIIVRRVGMGKFYVSNTNSNGMSYVKTFEAVLKSEENLTLSLKIIIDARQYVKLSW